MTGKVVRLVSEKSYGFIRGKENGVDYFFHSTGFDGHWNDLIEDLNDKKEILVTFDDVQTSKGARAENVVRLDNGA